MKDYYQDTRLSQSALKAYFKCPNFYKAVYVDRTYSEEKDTFTLGRAVDILVTEGYEVFTDNFEVVKRRGESDKEQLTLGMFAMAERMASRVKQQPVMEMFKDLDTQTELYTDKYKAKLDFFGINKAGTCVIADLKTTQDIYKFEKSVHDYEYKFQLAFYRQLAKAIYGNKIKRFKCYIIAVDKTPEVKFAVWQFDQRAFKSEDKQIKLILDHLAENKDFSKRMKKGVCTECPPEINCQWSLTTKKDIKKL